MSEPPPPTQSAQPGSRIPALTLALGVLVAWGWFYNGADINQIARYDMVFAFVEPHPTDQYTFRIDRFVDQPATGLRPNTWDWSNNPKHDAHHYPNKAPGPSLLAIPFYFVMYHVEEWAGLNPLEPSVTYVNCYLLNLIVTVIPAALAAMVFYAFLHRWTHQPLWSYVCTAGLFFGTSMFPFGTQFWGHSLAASMLVLSVCLGSGRSRPHTFAAGCLMGMVVLSEYTGAMALVTVVAAMLWQKRWKSLPTYFAGGLLPLALYAGYHWICFGNPIVPGVIYTNSRFLSEHAVGGLFYLTSFGEALWGTTFSPYRGIFWYMPVLLTAPVAFGPLRSCKHRQWILPAAAIALLFALMNACFNGWDGGNGAGPRYLILSLSMYWLLIAIGGARILRQARTRWKLAFKITFGGLLAVSLANMWVITIISPQILRPHPSQPEREQQLWRNPLGRYFYPLVTKGFVQPRSEAIIQIRQNEIAPEKNKLRMFTVGRGLGLPGIAEVLPALVLWLGLMIWGGYTARPTPEEREPDS